MSFVALSFTKKSCAVDASEMLLRGGALILMSALLSSANLVPRESSVMCSLEVCQSNLYTFLGDTASLECDDLDPLLVFFYPFPFHPPLAIASYCCKMSSLCRLTWSSVPCDVQSYRSGAHVVVSASLEHLFLKVSRKAFFCRVSGVDPFSRDALARDAFFRMSSSHGIECQMALFPPGVAILARGHLGSDTTLLQTTGL